MSYERGKQKGSDRSGQVNALVFPKHDTRSTRFDPNQPDLSNIKSHKRFKVLGAQINQFAKEGLYSNQKHPASRWARLMTEYVFGDRVISATQRGFHVSNF